MWLQCRSLGRTLWPPPIPSAAARLVHGVTDQLLPPAILRPYQQECIAKSLEALSRGVKRQIISLPVASGKTTVFAHLIPLIPCPTPQATKILVLAHKTELIQQAVATFRRALPGVTLGVEEGSKRADSKAQIVVASVATLGKKISERIKEARFDPSQYKAIIIDEAHHAAAPTYQRILRHFRAHEPDTSLLVWGCTATIRRHDGLSLKTAFDEIVYHRTIQDMIREEWLCDMTFERIVSKTSLDGLPQTFGDFAPGALSQRVDNGERNALIGRAYIHALQKHCRSTLIFAASVSHIQSLVTMFKDQGVHAEGLDGTTPPELRRSILERFKQRKFPILINCGIVVEGVDIPAIDCIILGRPTRSLVLLQQMLGRGLRPHPDKEFCRVIDICDTILKAKIELATVPTLLGLSRDFDFEESKMSTIMEKIEPSLQRGYDLHKCKSISDVENATAYDEDRADDFELRHFKSPFSFEAVDQRQALKDESYALRAISKFAWVRTGPSECALELPNRKALVIRKESDGLFQCTYHRKRMTVSKSGNNRYFSLKTVLVSQDTLEWAVKSADTWVLTQPFGKYNLYHNARWRREPPSARQIETLEKLDMPVEPSLTKGEAADMLTRRMRGNAARLAEQERKRTERQLAKEEARRKAVQLDRTIQVGSL
ncbi:P-loop containing nucleoside triphosphate hydrolase protein [Powellomyces hirtus]|nr:P-loop containing nucleoside triphosphate hydrolase protein [Powellomyces hirtus]